MKGSYVKSSYSFLGPVRNMPVHRTPRFRSATEDEVREHMAAWEHAGWEIVAAQTMYEEVPQCGRITVFHFFWKATATHVEPSEMVGR